MNSFVVPFRKILIQAGVIILIWTAITGLVLHHWVENSADKDTAVLQAALAEEIGAQDLVRMSVSLNKALANISWACIKALHNEGEVFQRRRSECHTGALRRSRSILHSAMPSVRLEATLELRESEKVRLTFLYFFGLLTVVLLVPAVGIVRHYRAASAFRLQEMAASLAHDLRSPLAALKSIAGEIQELSSEKRSLLLAAIARLDSIASNLLLERRSQEDRGYVGKYQGLEGERISLKAEHLASLVVEVVEEKKLGDSGKSQVQLELYLSEGSYLAFAQLEGSQFKRALSNVINNAFEASPSGSVVKVFVEVREGLVRVSTKDEGAGMSDEALNKLRQGVPFTTKEDGNGIGAMQAKKAIEAMGGVIEIHSAQGLGTTISFVFDTCPSPFQFCRIEELAGKSLVWVGGFEANEVASVVGEVEGKQRIVVSDAGKLRSWLREDIGRILDINFFFLLGKVEDRKELLNVLSSFELVERSVFLIRDFRDNALASELSNTGCRILLRP